jgi:hypothetical protein
VANLAWLNTTLLQPSKIVESRFTKAGMNCAADGFYEYKTVDEQGNIISPASNVLEFTHSTGNKKYETILTDEEAANYAKDVVFADAPDEFKSRINATTPTGIETVQSTATRHNDGAIYNMQGMRVKNAGKGLFIINGKKVVVK